MSKQFAMLEFSNKDLSFIDDPFTGDTVFQNVVLLAEGTWTDKHSQKTIFYPGDEIRKMEFKDRTVKMVHDIYNKLPVSNEIGVVENERFEETPNPRWVGNVRMFPTMNGSDMITLLKRKQITDISPEVFHILTPSENGTFVSSDILFMGVAPVRQGACNLCTFNEGGNSMPNDKEPNKGAQAGVNDKAGEVAALEATLAQKVLIKEQTDKIAALTLQIAELEKVPIIHTMRNGANSGHSAAELDGEMYPAYMARDFGSD